MDQQVHFLTLATADLDAARRFYVEGLGWRPLLDVPGEIVFFQIAPGTVLDFFEAGKFAQDLGRGPARPEVSGLTLAHNVASRDAVTAVVDAMAAAGGTVLTAPEEGAFGGVFHALVADPNGVVWEVAHNPGWSVDADGTVRMG
jgi:catechol 2,3-dioxygenase-like lactoylglutathione lyase family enzyme